MAPEPFDHLQRFILRERELFGETVIAGVRADPQVQPQEADMPRRKKGAGEEEPGLFGGGGSGGPGAREREPWEDARSLEELEEQIHDCRKCRLWETRTKFVFGVGNPQATFMLVGEAHSDSGVSGSVVWKTATATLRR